MKTINEAMNKLSSLKEAKLICPLKLVDNEGNKWNKSQIKEYISNMKNKYNVKITVTNKDSFGANICNIRGSKEDLKNYIENELDSDAYEELIEY